MALRDGLKMTLEERTAKIHAAQKTGRSTTMEGLGDDQGGGLTFCGNCNARVPDYKTYGDNCDKCDYVFIGMNITPYPFGGSDY